MDGPSLATDMGFALRMSMHRAGGNGSTSRIPAVPRHRGTHCGWRRVVRRATESSAEVDGSFSVPKEVISGRENRRGKELKQFQQWKN